MESNASRGMWLLGGLAIGMGMMFMLDPDRGRTRRALMRDKAGSMLLHTNTSMGKQARNARNHLMGMVAETRGRLRRGGMTDEALAERIRWEIERLAPKPGPIHAMIDNGRVTLSGPCLAGQVQQIVELVAMAPGVVGVNNRMTVYQSAGDMPAQSSASG